MIVILILLCCSCSSVNESEGPAAFDNSNNTNYLVAIDSLGRVMQSKATGNEKKVGIFSSLWMGQPCLFSDIYNSDEILKMENGADILLSVDTYDPQIAPANEFYYPFEPLFGYYNAADEWVIRKHLALLAMAGIDFIMFDVTNGVIYELAYKKYMAEAAKMIDDGLPAPKICFYTHSRSLDTIRALYEQVYRNGFYAQSWFTLDGKPLMIGYSLSYFDILEAKSRGDADYRPEELSTEILDFFTFKNPIWPGDTLVPNDSAIPWMDWSYPQQKYGNIMNVSASSHNRPPYSCNITHGDSWGNRGRGYDLTQNKNISSNAASGTLYQKLWENAINNDPDIITLCNWAGSLSVKTLTTDYGLNEYTLCDSLNAEFSTDIEPMNGNYMDNFLIQTAINIRQYKESDTVLHKTENKSVSLNSLKGWSDVQAVYRDFTTETSARNYVGSAKTVSYTQPKADNDIISVRICRDSKNIYMLIQTKEPPVLSSNHLNVLIGTGTPCQKGFAGYEYILLPNENAYDLYHFDDDCTTVYNGSKTKCANASYSINGCYLQIQLPISAIGKSEFYFKVADSIENPNDIMSYYVSGESLPMGRFSFYFPG